MSEVPNNEVHFFQLSDGSLLPANPMAIAVWNIAGHAVGEGASGYLNGEMLAGVHTLGYTVWVRPDGCSINAAKRFELN